MRFAEVTREITLNIKLRASRDSWPPYKEIGCPFGPDDGFEQCLVLIESKVNISPYTPTKDDIMANDWRLF